MSHINLSLRRRCVTAFARSKQKLVEGGHPALANCWLQLTHACLSSALRTHWGGAVLAGMGWYTARRVCSSATAVDCETRLSLQMFIPVYAAPSTLAKVFKSFCSECLCRRHYIELSPMPSVHSAINYHSITITSWINFAGFPDCNTEWFKFSLFSNCIIPHCWINLSSPVSFSIFFLHML